MQTVYFVCAIAGGTGLLWQLVMSTFGGHAGHDLSSNHDVSGIDSHLPAIPGHDGAASASHDPTSHDGQSSWFLGVLTLRTVIAAIAFFGFAGMAASTSGVTPVSSFEIAVGAGVAGLYLVASMMRGLSQLRAEGTAHVRRSLGQPGIVYLTIPAVRSGTGKVTMTVQGRTMEYQAVTAEQELPTGTPIVVVGILSPDTVEVIQSTNPAIASQV